MGTRKGDESSMKLSSLTGVTGAILKGNDLDLPLKIRVDSREISPGEGFVALRGANVDGHRFIPDVLKIGVALIVCEESSYKEEWLSEFPECSFMLCKERCEYGLSAIANEYLKKLPSLRDVIAITGSVGKTSTKNDVLALLEGHFKVHSAERNYNTLIGGAVTVLAAPLDTEILLLEMGANHGGEIAEMVRFLPPTVAAVTEISPVHLEGFVSVEGVLAAKSEIFSSSALRCAIVNGDNELLISHVKKLGLPRFITFGRRGDAAFSRDQLRWQKDHFSVSAILTGIDGLSFNVSLQLAGVHQLYPLCCAVAIAGYLGLSSRVIASDLPKCHSLTGRGEIRHSESGATILDECYNASPAAVMASLASMVSAEIPGRRFLVLGEMRELGEATEKEHAKVFRRALQVSEEIFLFGPVWENVEGAGKYCYDSLDSLILAVDKKLPDLDDVILVKGSRDNHLERVVRALEL